MVLSWPFFFGIDVVTIADWRALTGYDINGVSIDPQYYDPTCDLHVCADDLDNQGLALPSVAMDLDGIPRNSTSPDIGAYEYGTSTSYTLGPDLLICPGETIVLSATNPSDTILWSTTDTTYSIDVTLAGEYSVFIKRACGDTIRDTILITASTLMTFYKDSDGDASIDSTSCNQPAGYVTNMIDCDDTESIIGAIVMWYKDGE